MEIFISKLFLKNSAESNRDAIAKPSTETACNSNHRSYKTTTNLTSLVLNSAITKVEHLWCLKTILPHSSFRSW